MPRLSLTDLRDLYRTFGSKGARRRLEHEFLRRTGLYGRLQPNPVTNSMAAPPQLPSHAAFAVLHQNTAASEVLWKETEALRAGSIRYFGGAAIKGSWPPSWFYHPKTCVEWATDKPWTEILTNSPQQGDIKWIWEPSRFGAAWLLARCASINGSQEQTEEFWTLLEDWLEKNPAYVGPNWVCGQETSLRLFAVHFAVSVLGMPVEETRRRALSQFYADSGRRIELAYKHALSQRNNHALSELVGLWTCSIAFPELSESQHWASVVEQELPRCLSDQFAKDGAYIQESFNYHRVAVQVLLWHSFVSEQYGVSPNDQVEDCLERSFRFLLRFVNPETGWLPNYGANDGALVLPLSSCEFPDFRPTLQCLALRFDGKRMFDPGPWDEFSAWLLPESALSEQACTPTILSTAQSSDSGYFTSNVGNNLVYCRVSSHTNHRPSHADSLHTDIWFGSRNVALDPGTFSYTSPAPWDNSLDRTRVHNTCSVGEQSQMKKVGRFLWTNWTRSQVIRQIQGTSVGLLLAETQASVSGARHHRLIVHHCKGVHILDYLVALRPELLRLHWNLEGDTWEGDWIDGWYSNGVHVHLEGLSRTTERFIVGDDKTNLGWHSRRYGSKEPCSALELETYGRKGVFYSSFTFPGFDRSIHLDVLRELWETARFDESADEAMRLFECTTG